MLSISTELYQFFFITFTNMYNVHINRISIRVLTCILVHFIFSILCLFHALHHHLAHSIISGDRDLCWRAAPVVFWKLLIRN